LGCALYTGKYGISALQRRTLQVTFIWLYLKLFPGIWREYSGHCDATLSLCGRVVHADGSVERLFVQTVAGEGDSRNLQLKILTDRISS
jgi:hypothetical protein